MTIHSIARTSLPDRDTFFREYVFKRKPVVITNLFASDPIAEVRTLQDALRRFGDVKLLVRQEYISARNTPERFTTSVMTFAQYWAHIHQDPASTLLCTEYEIPARIMTQFTLPSICLASDLGQSEILGFPRRYGDHDLYGNLFIAGRGNKAHIHYDGDQRQVLLYQVFGRKEVILLPPASGARFKPLDQYNLDLYLDLKLREEKYEIIDQADGYHTVLEPGEAIYMPHLIWHYLEYMDHAMSFNLRFGRNRYGRFLCVDNFHRDYYLQNFASHLGDPELCETRFADGLAAITTHYPQPASNLPTKVREMRQLFRGLCEQFCPEARVDQYEPQTEEDQLREILRDLVGRTPYPDYTTVMRMRPAGPISSTQRSLIDQRIRKFGYSREQITQLICNRTGKLYLDDLNKAEAVQMISYLASPGAEL